MFARTHLVDLSFNSIEDLLAKIDMKNMALRNNAGGFYNHKLFWEVITPGSNSEMSTELKDAIEKIVDGASFDHGIICSHEQFVFAPEENFDETIELFTNTGKVWFTNDQDQIQKLREVVFLDGNLNKDIVGKSASYVGKLAGIDIPDSSRLILLPADGSGTEDVLAKEKLCPVIAIVPYSTFEDAVKMAKANLLVEGAGHSAALHSNNDQNIQKAGLELPISRLVINQPSSTSAGGSLTNGFAPTTTLGCGSWGGNSISENLDYKHLMNVSRIGKVSKSAIGEFQKCGVCALCRSVTIVVAGCCVYCFNHSPA